MFLTGLLTGGGMSSLDLTLWIEGDISTNRVITRFLNDLNSQILCKTRLVGDLNWHSLVDSLPVFCRVCHPDLAWLPKYLKDHNVPYCYYIDDNFWQMFGDSDICKYYQDPRVVFSLDEFVRNSSVIITNSASLHDFIGVRFPMVRREFLPAPFDVSYTQSLLSQKEKWSSDLNTPVVGYAGGFKLDEFEFLEQVVFAVLEKNPSVRFEFIGGCSKELKNHPSVQWFPGFSDYSEYLAFKVSRNWTVGLAPLFASDFNASKTDNKFREYAGCGIAGVYSNNSPYINSVVDMTTGLLVDNNVNDWLVAIDTLLSDEILRNRLKSNAIEDVQRRYSHDSIGGKWLDVFSKIFKPHVKNRIDVIRFKYVKTCHAHHDYKNAYKFSLGSDFLVLKKYSFDVFKLFADKKNIKSLVALGVVVALVNINYFIFKMVY